MRGAAAAVAGGRLGEIRAGRNADLAQPDLVFVLQKTVLEDHLYNCAGLMRRFDDYLDVLAGHRPSPR